MIAGWFVIAVASLAVLVLALIVSKVHGPHAALVMLAFSAAALVCVWVSFEEVPIEAWRRGNLLHGLVIFALPAAAATCVAVLRARRGGHGGSRAILPWRSWLFLAALWVGPPVLLYTSQLAPFGADTTIDRSFANSLWWATTSIAIYVAIPCAYALITGQRIKSYGLSLGFVRSEATLIALIAPAVLALVWLASADERFPRLYPFYDVAHGGDGAMGKLAIFEIAYGATFVALEFFFRGFLVFAGQPVLGVHAVPAMAFAYCLLHLGKPMPECASSLIGGLILGYLALRFRSIAAGVVAHLTMAWGMDAVVLMRY